MPLNILNSKIYMLPSVTGLKEWIDYIPVQVDDGGRVSSTNDAGGVEFTEILSSNSGLIPWLDYIPVYATSSRTVPWYVGDAGYIPYVDLYPSALFAIGEQGAWYDPSDLSTMFQDSAGTTPVTAVEQPVGKILDKSGNGNHATQSTSSARPTLRARYNLLTYSEDLTNAAWTKSNVLAFGSGSTANATTAPDGTTTADLLTEDSTATAAHRVFQVVGASIAAPITLSFYVKAPPSNARTHVYIRANDGGGDSIAGTVRIADATVTQTQFGSIAATDVGGGWIRVVGTGTAVGGGNLSVEVRLANADTYANYSGDGASGLYLWGFDCRRPSSAAGTYQRIAAATDYDSDASEFPYYLDFDGTDDSLATPYMDLTTSQTVFAGVMVNSVAAGDKVIFSQRSTASDTPIRAQLDFSAATARAYTRNDAGAGAGADVAVSAGQNYVLTGVFSATSRLVRKDGVPGTASNADASGATTLTHNSVGRAEVASPNSYLGGRLYSLIVRGAASSATEIAQTEAYVARKAGVTL